MVGGMGVMGVVGGVVMCWMVIALVHVAKAAIKIYVSKKWHYWQQIVIYDFRNCAKYFKLLNVKKQ